MKIKINKEKRRPLLIKAFSLFLFFSLFTSSCNFSNQSGNAPKDISNSQIVLIYKKTGPDFQPLEGKALTYNFHPDLTYESYLDKKVFATGDYAYNKTESDSAELTISYTSGVNIEDQILHLFFQTKIEGDFEAIPYSSQGHTETGSFRYNPKAAIPKPS